jgi:hypothetical protein
MQDNCVTEVFHTLWASYSTNIRLKCSEMEGCKMGNICSLNWDVENRFSFPEGGVGLDPSVDAYLR